MISSGRIWKLGDDIDTDVLAPGKYMSAPLEELASHCLEAVEPGFASQVNKGDLIVAGRNFGMGSSREQAAQALKMLGIVAVIAKSFAGLFYRNAINLGLPVLESADIDRIVNGRQARFDLKHATLHVEGVDEPVRCEPIPDNLLAILADGGLVPHLEKRFGVGERNQ